MTLLLSLTFIASLFLLINLFITIYVTFQVISETYSHLSCTFKALLQAMVTCPAVYYYHSSRTGLYMSMLASLKSFLNIVAIVILSKCKSDHITSLSFTRIFKYLPITLRKEPTALDRACTVWLQGLVSRFSAAPYHPVLHWLSGRHHTTHLLGSKTSCSILSKGFCTQLFCLPRKCFPSPCSVLNFESLFRSQLKSYFFRKAFPNYAKSPIWALLHSACNSFNFTFAYAIIQL